MSDTQTYIKKAMHDEVQYFLDTPEHTVPWTKDESASRLVHFVYHGGIWDQAFRSYFPALKKKKVKKLTEEEVLAYLTMIVCTDRTQEGCIDHHIQSGQLEELLRRWLEITEAAK